MNAAAIRLIEESGLSLMDAAFLIRELTQHLDGREQITTHAQMCIRLGKEELGKRKKTVPFRQAVEESLVTKQHRRPRTLSEIKTVCTRFMKYCPKLANKPVRAIRTEDCLHYIRQAFSTPRQQYKARLILSGVFSIARKRGWCDGNPATRVELPPFQEQPIRALSLQEVGELVKSAKTFYDGACIPPLALMLYAGIRPAETTRLTWSMINLEEKVICLHASHSKTGGSRHVHIHPVLHALLKQWAPGKEHASAPVCPPNWLKKWRHVRLKAGWSARQGKPWPQDVLRHTYASYHAKQFHNYTELQYEMGHSCLHLLKSRYLNMEGISKTDASRFWAA